MSKRKVFLIIFALLVCLFVTAAFVGCSDKSDDGEEDIVEKTSAVTNALTEDITEVVTDAEDTFEETTAPDEESTEEYTQAGIDIMHEGFGENKNYVVVIDAGHQRHGMTDKEPNGPGSDTMKNKVTSGTQGSFTGVPEYELTLAVSLALRDELMSRGYTVVMVRETHDVEVSNIERAQIANKYAPTEENGYISAINVRIHANGFTDPSANGAIMCCPTKNNPYKIGEIFEECERLANAIIDPYCQATGVRKRPSHIQYGDNMTGTNWCEIPTTILEMGFMTNEGDDMLMQTPDFKENAAIGIANGIDNFFKPAK